MINLIEKIINEHGSSAILREHLELLRAQILDLQFKNTDLASENEKLKLIKFNSQENIRVLEEKVSHLSGGNNSGHFCEHCGSSNIKRTGSKPHPSMGRHGVKFELFKCNECDKESSFLVTPK